MTVLNMNFKASLILDSQGPRNPSMILPDENTKKSVLKIFIVIMNISENCGLITAMK